jgi:hypothetical protein
VATSPIALARVTPSAVLGTVTRPADARPTLTDPQSCPVWMFVLGMVKVSWWSLQYDLCNGKLLKKMCGGGVLSRKKSKGAPPKKLWIRVKCLWNKALKLYRMNRSSSSSSSSVCVCSCM